jgi:phospholipase/lecithinase/hemolysin
MIGGNDVANNLADLAEGDLTALEAGIGSIVSQITNLYEEGVDQFVVANVPDIGATPLFQAGDPVFAQLATFWTTQWNAALATALDGLSASLPEVVISELDLFSLGKDPELLALFANTTDACLAPPSICSDPASYFYWDSFHPSSTAHALIAEAAHAAYVTTLLDRLLADVTGVGPGKSLANKVSGAQASFAAFNTNATCGKLGAFTNQIGAQAGKKLTDAQADEFTSDAHAIMDAIGCD